MDTNGAPLKPLLAVESSLGYVRQEVPSVAGV